MGVCCSDDKLELDPDTALIAQEPHQTAQKYQQINNTTISEITKQKKSNVKDMVLIDFDAVFQNSQTSLIPNDSARIRLQNEFKGEMIATTIKTELMDQLKSSTKTITPPKKSVVDTNCISKIHSKIKLLVYWFLEDDTCPDVILSFIVSYAATQCFHKVEQCFSDTVCSYANDRRTFSDNNHKVTCVCNPSKDRIISASILIYCKYEIIAEPTEAFIVKWNIHKISSLRHDDGIRIMVRANHKGYSYRCDGRIESGIIGYVSNHHVENFTEAYRAGDTVWMKMQFWSENGLCFGSLFFKRNDEKYWKDTEYKIECHAGVMLYARLTMNCMGTATLEIESMWHTKLQNAVTKIRI